jgi:hypothetical protein
LLDRATSTHSTSRSTDLTVTIPLTTTSTLLDTLISYEVLDTFSTIFTLAFITVLTTRTLSTYTRVIVSRPTVTLSADRPVFYTADVAAFTNIFDTNAISTIWTQTSSVFWTAVTETSFGPTIQTYSKLYGP